MTQENSSPSGMRAGIDRRRRSRKSTGALTVLLSLGMVLAACAAEDDAAPGDGNTAPGDGTALTVAFNHEPSSWDYVQEPTGAIGFTLQSNVIEPLIERREDGSFEPLLAESFDVSDDGLEYTFVIREATFHDGTELAADDVVYSLEYNRTSPHNQGVWEAVEGIEEVDDRRVRVTLSRPSQGFLGHLGRAAGMIIPVGSSDQLGTAPVGTGPYRFVEWRNGVDATIARFDGYWGELPYFEDVTFRFEVDESVSLNGLLAGDIDIVHVLVGEGIQRVAEIEETEGFAVHSVAGPAVVYSMLNAGEEVFDDERIRQAIAHAIDRDELNEGVVAGLGQPICTFASPAESSSSDYCPYPHDPDRSRQLLTEAGAEDLTLRFKHLTIGVTGTEMTEILASQLADVGIEFEREARDFATFIDEVRGDPPEYQLSTFGHQAGIEFYGGCPANETGDCMPKFDELLADADASLEREQWTELRREAAELQADRAYLLPLFSLDVLTAHRDDLAGLRTFKTDQFDLRDLHWIE